MPKFNDNWLELDYCVLKNERSWRDRKPNDKKVVDCNNLEDTKTIEERMRNGETFRSIRKSLGYAGKFKKISAEKHDDMYCTDGHDALELHLGIKEGYSIKSIIKGLEYVDLGWALASHGYKLHKLWSNHNYDTIVVPWSDANSMQNFKEIYVRRKDGMPIERNILMGWLKDSKDRSEEEFLASKRFLASNAEIRESEHYKIRT